MNGRQKAAAFVAAVVLTLVPGMLPADPAIDLTPSLQQRGIDLGSILVIQAEGILILRGQTTSVAKAEQAVATVKSLGYRRIANLIRIDPAPDDVQIQRTAERALSISRSLEGCRFTRVRSDSGIVTLHGQVRHESQKDAARAIIRTVEGVRDVRLLLDVS